MQTGCGRCARPRARWQIARFGDELILSKKAALGPLRSLAKCGQEISGNLQRLQLHLGTGTAPICRPGWIAAAFCCSDLGAASYYSEEQREHGIDYGPAA